MNEIMSHRLLKFAGEGHFLNTGHDFVSLTGRGRLKLPGAVPVPVIAGKL